MYCRVSSGCGLFAEADRFSLELLVFWFYDQLCYVAHAVNGECMIAILIANYGDELVLATSQLGTFLSVAETDHMHFDQR